MRKKGKRGKVRKILIRVDDIEKEMSEELSRDRGMNTSEFMRHLLHEYEENQRLELHLKLTESNKQLANNLKTALAAVIRKNRG